MSRSAFARTGGSLARSKLLRLGVLCLTVSAFVLVLQAAAAKPSGSTTPQAGASSGYDEPLCESGKSLCADIHDNPGAAIAVRPGASARITHNVFQRNGTSPYAPAPIILAQTADLSFAANVLYGITPAAFHSLSEPVRAAVIRDNWFLDPHAARSTPSPRSRGQRGAQP